MQNLIDVILPRGGAAGARPMAAWSGNCARSKILYTKITRPEILNTKITRPEILYTKITRLKIHQDD